MKVELHGATTEAIFAAFVETDAMLGRLERVTIEQALIRNGKIPLPLLAGETPPRSHWQTVNLIVARVGKDDKGQPKFDPNTISLYLDELEEHYRKTPAQEVVTLAT